MFHQHVVNSINRHDLVSDSTLHVVAVISNTQRYHSRYRLFRDFEAEMLKTANVCLHVVETAFGDRHHEVTDAANGSHLQLRTMHELWHKENMINRAVTHLLPRDWKYLAWVDADVSFSNPHWALDTIHQLQHYAVVQPWSECVDLGPKGAVTQMQPSFASLVNQGVRVRITPKEPYAFGHMGYATACTRTFFENVGGLIDWGILGSGDSHMAYAMIGKVGESVSERVSDEYRRALLEWQRKAMRETHGTLGFVPGYIVHKWHGRKQSRKYLERWQILTRHKFDPFADLRKDHQGLYQLIGKPQLQEDIRQYFAARNEDSVDV